MWLDVLALLVLGIFIGMGTLRGGLASGMGLASLLVAYVAAFRFAPGLGSAVAGPLGLPDLLGVPIAGTLVFVVTYALMGVVSAFLRRRERRRRGPTRSPRDRFLGGAFGAIRGAMVVLLLCWLALWIDTLRATGTVESLPDVSGSTAAALTGRVVEAGIGAALGDSSSGRLMARMAARPGPAIVDFQALLDHRGIEGLREDRLFWSYVEYGNVDAALNRASFIGIARDMQLRGQLADLGLIEAEAATDDREFRAAIAEVLREVGPRIRGLREDPELQRLLDDPEVAAMLQSGDSIGLVGHRGFRELVTRVAAGSGSTATR